MFRSKIKPKWMTSFVMKQICKKEKAWKHYRKKKTRISYNHYSSVRNDTTRIVREAKYNFEHQLARDIKSDPKAFYAYAQ